MKIAIVDDNPEEASLLSRYLSSLTNPQMTITRFHDGALFLKSQSPHDYDVIILDIFMNGMSGIDVAKEIRQKDTEVCLVFCTTSNEFASESYEVEAGYYLHKPITREKVNHMLSRLDLDALQRTRSVTLPNGKRVLLHHILYTECFGHNIILHLKGREELTVRMTFSQTEQLLGTYSSFVCCSKGVLVNLDAVTGLNEKGFLLEDTRIVPVSRRKMKDMKTAYADFMFQKMRKEGG